MATTTTATAAAPRPTAVLCAALMNDPAVRPLDGATRLFRATIEFSSLDTTCKSSGALRRILPPHENQRWARAARGASVFAIKRRRDGAITLDINAPICPPLGSRKHEPQLSAQIYATLGASGAVEHAEMWLHCAACGVHYSYLYPGEYTAWDLAWQRKYGPNAHIDFRGIEATDLATYVFAKVGLGQELWF
jgi:hypothetical protein